MIKGLGNDLVEIARITHAIERHGDRFAEKILNESELALYHASSKQDIFLAKRFAVKEAVSKALGTGVAMGVSWHDIELCHFESGQPYAKLSGGGAARLAAMSAETVLVSLSDEAGMVSACAVIS